MAAPSPREENVYMAKRAEQAERYEEMVQYMEKAIAFASTGEELTIEERNLLSVTYKNVIGARRASWRIVSSTEQKEESRGNQDHVSMIKEYRSKIEAELTEICGGILKLLDQKLVPAATELLETGSSYKMINRPHNCQHNSFSDKVQHYRIVLLVISIPIMLIVVVLFLMPGRAPSFDAAMDYGLSRNFSPNLKLSKNTLLFFMPAVWAVVYTYIALIRTWILCQLAKISSFLFRLRFADRLSRHC